MAHTLDHFFFYYCYWSFQTKAKNLTVEQSLLTPEVRGLKTIICKLYITYILSAVLKNENKKREAGNGELKYFVANSYENIIFNYNNNLM